MNDNKKSVSDHIAKLIESVDYFVNREGNPKRLSNRKRLNAAAQIGLMVQDLQEHGTTATELCELLSDQKAVEPFRLYRWMLRGDVTQVDDALVASYEDKPEPLKSTKKYLWLAKRLAEIGGHDPLEAQGEMLSRMGLTGAPRHSLKRDLEPEERLSNLLRDFAADFAEKNDLAAFFQLTERVQAGCNLKIGPEALVDLVDEDSANFLANSAPTRYYWLETAAPALPSALVARLPFRCLSGPFRTRNGRGTGPSLQGYAVAFWDLRVAIAPAGRLSVGAYLVRSSSVDLFLNDDAEATGMVNPIPLDGIDDDVEQLILGHPRLPVIEIDGETWEVYKDADVEDVPAPRSNTDIPPSWSVPNAHIEPVTIQSIRTFLMSEFTLSAENGPVFLPIDLLEIQGNDLDLWIRRQSIAQNVERALRDGRLAQRISEWLEIYKPQLNAFEENWRRTMIARDARLSKVREDQFLGDVGE